MDLNKIFMKNATPTKVGGQAVLEGLMMRGSRALAIAVRRPDGDIHLAVEPLAAPGSWTGNATTGLWRATAPSTVLPAP